MSADAVAKLANVTIERQEQRIAELETELGRLGQIVIDLAATEPEMEWVDGPLCVICRDRPHAESCPWRRAVEATKGTLEEGTQ